MASISVVIPTFNRAGVVGRAIQSVFDQTHQAHEIIVVNDGSSDDTRSVLDSYGPKIRAIHQSNAGLSGARNSSIRAATSEWIAFLDDDDEYTPLRLAIVSESIRRHPQASVHMTNIAIVGVDGSVVDLYAYRGNSALEHSILERPLKWGLKGCAFAQGLVVRRSLLIEVGLFRQTFYEDMDLFVRLAARGIWTVDPRCCVKLIRRPGEDLNLSSLWKSKPIENYSSLVRIHREALSSRDLGVGERRDVEWGLATNLFELGCSYYAVGNLEEGRKLLGEAKELMPTFRSKFRIFCVIHAGYLGVIWAKRRNSRRRAIRG